MLKRVVIIVALSFVFFSLMLCAVFAASLKGTYTLVGDSDGTTLKKGAVATITFKGANTGTVSMQAKQPGETVVDTGTFSVSGSTITIQFNELDWRAEKQPFQLDDCTLVLPFRALGFTEGPGTSTWIRKDPACSKDIATKRQALSGPSAGTDSDKQAASEGGDQGPLTGLEGKESCAQCKYIPCIKSLIGQKEAMVKALKTIAAERDWGSLEDAPQEGRDYVNIATMSKEASDYAINALNAERGALTSDLDGRIDSEITTGVKKNCPFSADGVIMMQANSTVCNIDQQSIDSAIKAIPCAEIARFMYYHETYHYTQCRERLKKKMVGVLTARGEAREDVAAYALEIQQLKDLLAEASKSSKGGCWRCGKTQVVYPSAPVCNEKCEKVRLGGSIMFKCWKLNEKGEHILTPGNRF
ncbi:MAG: lipocalin family protein [Deltaproteobacteria bacterium]|nr:lipocalin family protein [Deltaproteobacteria bacterium]